MIAGLFARAPRLAVLVVVALLATAGLTFAASSTLTAQPTTPPETTSELPPLVVPDVRHQAYVFAKGMLEQGGFAWRVEGSVHGYSANLVASQTPAPGSKLVANGAPTIVLRLQRNAGYAQQGTPEDKSPYAGVPGPQVRRRAPRQDQGQGEDEDQDEAGRCSGSAEGKGDEDHRGRGEDESCSEEAGGHTYARLRRARRAQGAARRDDAGRPRDEAQRLGLRASEAHAAAVDHWLYQHNWIVSGAKFGWSHGAESLRTLVAVDKRVQTLWGVGDDSETVARKALVDVKARSK